MMLLRSNEKAVRARRNILKEVDEYCPLIKGVCVGIKCLNVKRDTYSWTNEGCMGGETYHSYDYLYCKEYPHEVVWHLEGGK